MKNFYFTLIWAVFAFEKGASQDFTHIEALAHLDSIQKTNGVAVADYDQDGDLDLFFTGILNFTLEDKTTWNHLMQNQGNGSFLRNTSDVVTQDSSFSYGCAFGDYDNDGFEDLAVATCRFGGNDQADFLYHNTGNSNNWITFTLIGSISNKSAIGAGRLE